MSFPLIWWVMMLGYDPPALSFMTSAISSIVTSQNRNVVIADLAIYLNNRILRFAQQEICQ